MDRVIQQDLAQTAVSDPLAGDGSWIIWPDETDFSIMGRDRGTYDVMGPGGLPCPPSDFSIMGRDRGTYDMMSPGGLPGRRRPFPPGGSTRSAGSWPPRPGPAPARPGSGAPGIQPG